MKFKIPNEPGLKHMNSIKNDSLMTILFDDTDLDRMFALLFERCVKKGEIGPARRQKEFSPGGELNLEDVLIPQLSKHDALVGFDSERGRNILQNWVSTSVIQFTTVGKTKQGSQIDFMKFLTIGGYRAGLPKHENRSSVRQIDITFYRNLISYLGSLPGCEKPSEEIHEKVTSTSLAVGLDFEPMKQPWREPEFNGKDQVDINTLLELRLLENFSPRVDRQRASSNKPKSETDNVLPFPFVLEELSRDFYEITGAFKGRSSSELLSMYKSVFALRLYKLPILLSKTLKEFRSGNFDVSPNHEMFFDFTNSKKSASYELAVKCVLEDVNFAGQYLYFSVYLREAENIVRKISSRNAEFVKLDPESRVKYLFDFALTDIANDRAFDALEAFRDYYNESHPDSTEALKILEDSRKETHFETLIEVILSAIRQRGNSSLRKWFYSVAGLKSQKNAHMVSILGGDMRHITGWHYTMSDSVLNTLLHMCFLDNHGNLIKRTELTMEEVLGRLRKRFGVVIAVPPLGFESIENQRAASENFIAFKKRLRQLGWFEGLSDDFDAQHITKPAGDI
jgi:hypothetical protein